MKYLILFFLLLSVSAKAAVIHDAHESPGGWSFNYAATAHLNEKILFNIFVQRCQKYTEKNTCAMDQGQARDMATIQAKARVEAERKKRENDHR